MATLLSRTSGIFTSVSTWALVDPISFTGVVSETASGTVTTAYVASTTFTPGAITIDAIAVRLASRAAVPTGTMSVALDQAAVTVTGTEVTINVADLPRAVGSTNFDGGWIVFKFAAPVTLTAATAYSVKVKTLDPSQITLQSTSSSDWSRMLRTTTTQAPAAGDNMHIAGEYQGPSTNLIFTVTVDSAVTNAIDYGSAPTTGSSLVTPGIGISALGKLIFDWGASLNICLRLSNSLIVYNGGILNIGTVASPIARSSKAVLEFDQLNNDGDYGLIVRNGGTFIAQGQSRTSGKNVVSCKLAADAPSAVNLIYGASLQSNAVVPSPNNALDPIGISRLSSTTADTTAVTTQHYEYWLGTSVTNVTQVFTVWLARGSGTNNRYLRLQLCGNPSTAPSAGFYVEVDLQAGTVGAVTAIGTGTATSASITPLGTGYVVTIVGKVSSGSATSTAMIIHENTPGGMTYTGDGTQNLIYYGQALYTASALPFANLTVDTDTGWLSGDLVAVASTTQTYTDCEILALASNATSTTLTTSQVAIVSHSGTSPTQAEIICLTRNVVVRSTSSTLMAYVNIQAGATADLDWVQFYYLGANATNKRSIEVGSSTTLPVNFNMNYCSVHDCENYGSYLFVSSGSILITSCVLAYNVMWNLATVNGPGVQICLSAINPTNWTLDHNILIRTGNGNGFTVNDVGGTFTNNVAVGAAGAGIILQEPNRIGTFSGNVSHSNGGTGVTIAATVSGIISSTSVWRNALSSGGLYINTPVVDFVVDSLVAFGNASTNIGLTPCTVTFLSPVLNGDTTFSTISGIYFSTSGTVNTVIIDSGDFGTATGIKTAHSGGDIYFGSASARAGFILRNTKLASGIEIQSPGNLSERGYVSSQKHDRTAGNHVTWMKHGTVQTDTTVYRTAAPSLRMTPSMATFPITGTGAATSGSAAITAVSAYFFDWVVVGDWLATPSGFGTPVRVIGINAGTSTITVDRASIATAPTTGLVILRGKLPSAPPGKGFQIPANSGQTFNVGVWVRKQQENLYTYSEDFSNAAWTTGGNATLTGGQSDPFGATNAYRVLEAAVNSTDHGIARNAGVNVSQGATYTVTFYVKGGLNRQWIRIYEATRSSWIDITNGVTGTINAAHTITMTSIGSGWYRCSVTYVSLFNNLALSILSATADNNSATFMGDVTKGFYLFGVQGEQASTASAYQVTTATAINGYNGTVNPRLMQRANPAIGIASDIVLDTMTSSNGIWEQLTGTTTAPAADKGVVELVVDCEGTAGWVNVDDFSVT